MSPKLQVLHQATHALRQSHHSQLHKLKVEDGEDAIIISGQVASYYLKQLAQEAIMPVRGNLDLINRVHVMNSK